MNANLQGNHSLRSRPHIAPIGTYASTGNAQQGGILSLFHRYTEDAVSTIVPLHILERHLINIHVLGTTLRQKALRRIQVYLTRFLNGILPIVIEVLWHHRRGLQFLRREGSRTGTLIFLAADISLHVNAVETRCCHLALQRQGSVFQHHSLLFHILIHLRTRLVINGHIIQQGIRLGHTDLKRSSLSHFVTPVLVVWNHRNLNIITSYLCANGKHSRQHQQQEKESRMFHRFWFLVALYLKSDAKLLLFFE